MITHAMIDIREVTRRTGLGRKAISARMDPTCRRFDPEFPLPIRQGRFVGWIACEVDAYVERVSGAYKLASLLSEINEVDELLAGVPDGSTIDRISLENRLQALIAERDRLAAGDKVE